MERTLFAKFRSNSHIALCAVPKSKQTWIVHIRIRNTEYPFRRGTQTTNPDTIHAARGEDLMYTSDESQIQKKQYSQDSEKKRAACTESPTPRIQVPAMCLSCLSFGTALITLHECIMQIISVCAIGALTASSRLSLSEAIF